MARHPDIEIDLTMHDRFSGLIEDGSTLRCGSARSMTAT